ncbi:MAG: trypsin-like peptidase domain-containing protein [Thermoanaerobaculia bacterium]
MKRIVWFGVLALMLAAVPGFSAPPVLDFLDSLQEAHMETVGTPRDPMARATEMKALQQRLAGAQVEKAMARPVVIQLTAKDRQQIDEPTARDTRFLVGVAKPVGLTVDFAPAQALGKREGALKLGAARGTGDAGFVWTAEVKAPGATALRLHITDFDLPEGAELYVYNMAGMAFGPYTGRGPLGTGDLHTNTVYGDRLLVQLTSPAGERAPRLTVAEAGVMGARFVAPRYRPEGAFDANDVEALAKASNLCSFNANCIVNAACQSSAVVNAAKDAIASILYKSGASYYICTGGLVADTVTTSVIPYFLTAHHCISASGEASSLETYFDYETTCSNPNCAQPYNSVGETVGATIMATGSTSDYSLVRLATTPTSPDGVTTYLGWTATPIANTNNAGLYRISHPQGAPQAYTEAVVDTSKPTCRTLARGNFIYSRDTIGATEGGSSGSPVLNSSGQIVGQLYGACGTNLNDVCDAQNNGTVDGAFAVSYSALAAFLNPSSGGTCSAAGASCTTSSQCCAGLSCKGKVCR